MRPACSRPHPPTGRLFVGKMAGVGAHAQNAVAHTDWEGKKRGGEGLPAHTSNSIH